MSGHTPGPWKSREINPKDPSWGAHEVWPKKGGKPVATMVCGAANARLVAAAPDLLEACKALLVCMSLANWEGDPVAEAARAAIAKATGAA